MKAMHYRPVQRPLEKHGHGYMYLGNINDVLTDEGNAFQARAAATGKARSQLYVSRKHSSVNNVDLKLLESTGIFWPESVVLKVLDSKADA